MEERVRVLIQNTSTAWYCVNSVRWAPELDQAFDFSTPELAVDFIQEKHLSAVKVIYEFRDGSFAIPLGCPTSLGNSFILQH